MDKQHRHAVLAQLLYLANLLAIPGLALLLLWLLRYLLHDKLDSLSRYHFQLAISVGSGALLILGMPPLFLWLLGYRSAESWTGMLLFLLVTHTSLVIFGIYALAQAMTGRRLKAAGSKFT